MDQERVNSKVGSNLPTLNEEIAQKKLRVKKILNETSNLENDPFYKKNKIGKFECLLCYSTHNTESGYLIHRQGKKHQFNVNRRKVYENKVVEKKTIGRPKYSVKSIVDGEYKGFSIQIQYPNIFYRPFYRFVSSLEQTVEKIEENSNYVVFIGKPYENIGFKIENCKILEYNLVERYDKNTKTYYLQFFVEFL